jgi:hypothetical protein
MVDMGQRDVTHPLVIAPAVAVVDECGRCPLQSHGSLVHYQIHLLFHRAVVAIDLAVRLRVMG